MLFEHNYSTITPQFVITALFIVLISGLLKTACLSRVSCGLIDWSQFSGGFVQALIGADLQPHVKEGREKE